MKKLALIILILSLFAVTSYAQKYPINGLSMHVMELIDGHQTISAGSTIYVESKVFSTDCDSIAFIVSIVGDSTTLGTTRDSLSVYLKQQWVAPDDHVDVTAFASLDSVYERVYTSAGNLLHAPALATSASKPFRKMKMSIINYAEGAQVVYYKVWAIKRWR